MFFQRKSLPYLELPPLFPQENVPGPQTPKKLQAGVRAGRGTLANATPGAISLPAGSGTRVQEVSNLETVGVLM